MAHQLGQPQNNTVACRQRKHRAQEVTEVRACALAHNQPLSRPPGARGVCSHAQHNFRKEGRNCGGQEEGGGALTACGMRPKLPEVRICPLAHHQCTPLAHCPQAVMHERRCRNGVRVSARGPPAIANATNLWHSPFAARGALPGQNSSELLHACRKPSKARAADEHSPWKQPEAVARARASTSRPSRLPWPQQREEKMPALCTPQQRQRFSTPGRANSKSAPAGHLSGRQTLQRRCHSTSREQHLRKLAAGATSPAEARLARRKQPTPKEALSAPAPLLAVVHEGCSSRGHAAPSRRRPRSLRHSFDAAPVRSARLAPPARLTTRATNAIARKASTRAAIATEKGASPGPHTSRSASSHQAAAMHCICTHCTAAGSQVAAITPGSAKLRVIKLASCRASQPAQHCRPGFAAAILAPNQAGQDSLQALQCRQQPTLSTCPAQGN